MTQRTTVLFTNTISPMVFAVRPRLLLEEIPYDNLQYRRTEIRVLNTVSSVPNKTSVAVQCNGYAWLMTSKARLHVYPATSAAAADADDDVVVAS